jgi:hypothetical protein
MLMLEFGTPHLKVREPIDSCNTKSKKLLRLYERRLITISGDSRLTIFNCQWTIHSKREILADSNSTRAKIAKGLAILNGQILSNVYGHPDRGKWRFEFDLGGRIDLQSYRDCVAEEWWIYQHSGWTYAVRSDGYYRHTPPHMHIESAKWRPLKPCVEIKMQQGLKTERPRR